MSEDNRIVLIAITVLLGITILFSIGVVLITRSDFSMDRQDPLSEGSSQIDYECGVLMSSANEAFEDGRYDETSAALALVESLSCGTEYDVRAAELYRFIGRPYDGLRLLSDLRETNRSDSDLTATYAWSLFDCGLIDSARSVVRESLRMGILTSASTRSLAWLAVETDMQDAASRLFARALETDPNDPNLWRALSQIRLRAHDINGALHAAYRAREIDPTSCEVLIACGWAEEANGDTAAAQTAFESAREICPDDRTVAFETGRFYYRGGHFSRSIPFLQQAVREETPPFSWLMMLGRAESKSGDYQGARQAFSLATHHESATYGAFLECARIERALGNLQEAWRLGLLAQTLSPESDEISFFLSNLPQAQQIRR